MMGELLHWLAFALLAVAMTAAFAAISARSLFVTVMHLVAAGVSVAAVVLLLGEREGALGAALLMGAWAPVLLLGAMLLSTRAAKPARPGATVLGWLGAVLAAPLVWLPLAELNVRTPDADIAATGIGVWLAPLLLALAATCVALLGYGERGALTNRGAR